MSDYRDVLLSIREEHGRLTPRIVLEEARAAEHPLHSRFEWDDAIAGDKYRLAQAHDLITALKVKYAPADDAKPERLGRAFHAVRDAEGPEPYRYEPAETVAADPLMTKLVLADMEREWRALFHRYKQFSEFAVLVRGDLADVPDSGAA